MPAGLVLRKDRLRARFLVDVVILGVDLKFEIDVESVREQGRDITCMLSHRHFSGEVHPRLCKSLSGTC